MLRLYLQHPDTGLTVECPFTENHTGSTPVISVDWEMEQAVHSLVDKIAAKLEKPPMEILLTRPAFKIVAKWKRETA